MPKELTVYGDAKMVAKTLDDPKKYIGVRTLVIGGGNTAADIVVSILKAKREAMITSYYTGHTYQKNLT